jgi:DNA processing protein
MPPGSSPSARTLVQRNRLQSGLSSVTLVAQCGVESGTMYTARFAVEQDPTLAVARPPADEASEPASSGNLAMLEPDPSSEHPGATFALESVAQVSEMLDLISR